VVEQSRSQRRRSTIRNSTPRCSSADMHLCCWFVLLTTELLTTQVECGECGAAVEMTELGTHLEKYH
jgi:hypothetical protein